MKATLIVVGYLLTCLPAIRLWYVGLDRSSQAPDSVGLALIFGLLWPVALFAYGLKKVGDFLFRETPRQREIRQKKEAEVARMKAFKELRTSAPELLTATDLMELERFEERVRVEGYRARLGYYL